MGTARRPRPRASRTGAGALLVAAVTVLAGAGCVSNEYRISRNELQRLAQMPPEARGQRVHVVQGIGERRAEAIDPGEYREPVGQEQPGGSVDINLDGSWPDGGSQAGGGRASGGVPARGAGGGATGGWRGAPPRGAGSAFRGVPPPRGAGAGGGVHANVGSAVGAAGGGHNGADALVVVAVVLAAVAIVAAVALVAAEGARYDGYADLAPEQLLYVRNASGNTTPVALGDLSPAQADAAVEAKVMDDEWPGMRRLGRAPLDRTGGAFRLDMGTTSFNVGAIQVVGPAAHIQLGAFVNPWLGFLADIGLSGGGDCCAGAVTRHSLALEIDALPLDFGPLHAGVFAKGGGAIAGTGSLRQEGPIAGGGALVELALTSRLALTFRAGASAARFDDGWSSRER